LRKEEIKNDLKYSFPVFRIVECTHKETIVRFKIIEDHHLKENYANFQRWCGFATYVAKNGSTKPFCDLLGDLPPILI
jgi:hypothetical protein